MTLPILPHRLLLLRAVAADRHSPWLRYRLVQDPDEQLDVSAGFAAFNAVLVDGALASIYGGNGNYFLKGQFAHRGWWAPTSATPTAAAA